MMSRPLKNSWLRTKKKTESTNPVVKAANYVANLLKEYVYWPTQSLYHRYKERLKRSYAFAKIGWLNYDFDGAFLWQLMEFKLKRVHASLLKGYGVQRKEDMDALVEAAKITGRLFRDSYDDKYLREVDKKWGKTKINWKPDKDENGKVKTYSMLTKRKNVKTDADKEAERKDFLQAFKSAEQDRIKDLNRLNIIFKKHAKCWWD